MTLGLHVGSNRIVFDADNPHLVYAILWYHREFQRLATFTLNYGLAEIQRNMLAKASAGMSLFPPWLDICLSFIFQRFKIRRRRRTLDQHSIPIPAQKRQCHLKSPAIQRNLPSRQIPMQKMEASHCPFSRLVRRKKIRWPVLQPTPIAQMPNPSATKPKGNGECRVVRWPAKAARSCIS